MTLTSEPGKMNLFQDGSLSLAYIKINQNSKFVARNLQINSL